MTDPLDALREPIVPVDPDPAFAAELRARLERALLGQPDNTEASDRRGDVMTAPTAPVNVREPTLTPYLAVDDARRALDWYVAVFGAERRGEPYIMDDDRIGHAELLIGGSVLMLADEYPELGLIGPNARGGVSQSLHLLVPDVDATVERAVAEGGRLERAPDDQPYGRTGTITDPFGHRWMVQTPPAQQAAAAEQAEPAGQAGPAEPAGPAAPPTPKHGDIGYLTITVPDAERAKEFYGAVLGWRYSPGRVADGWQVEGPNPSVGLWGGQERVEVQLCYRVDDLDAALEQVRARGGEAEEPTSQPYGRLVECVDNQGARFQLWQPGES